MMEILTISSNLCAAFTDDGKIIPKAEVILILSEPTYSVDAAGEVVKRRETSTVRFFASPETLKKLAACFLTLSGESESAAKQFNK